MRCLQCGSELKENNKYCPGCGAKVDYHTVQVKEVNSYKKVKKKKIGFKTGFLIGIIIVSVLVIFFNIFTNFCLEGKEKNFEGEGFTTPEKAVTAYLDAMKKGNIKKMISICAIETYVKNYDVEKMVNRYGAYSNVIVPTFRNTDVYTQTVNIYVRQNSLVNNLVCQYVYLSGKKEMYLEPTVINKNEKYNNAEMFFNELMDSEWMEKLSDLKYGEVVGAENLKHILPEAYYSKEAEEFRTIRIDEQGADDIVSLAVKVKFDGKEYYFCPDVICYSGKWYLLDQIGKIAQSLGADNWSGGFYEIN